jgi:ribose transport system substrate-binding protein
MRLASRFLTACALSALAAGAAGGAAAQTPFYSEPLAFDLSAAFPGPDGSPATPASALSLSDEEVAKLKAGNYSAALLWHGAGDWVNAVTQGAQAKFDELGIKVVATADAQYDPAKQANDIETALALDPSIILTLILDPVSGAAALRPAVDRGVKIALLSNPVEGFAANKEYVGITTDDIVGMGVAAAEMMKDAVGEGPVGYIFHDANYFITNGRDQAFRATLEQKYPELVIVDGKGFTAEPQTFDLASAMIQQHPEIKGIYVAWDVAAEGVVEALRAADRTDVKVVTYDLGANNALDMANGGSFYGTVADMPYEIGQALATLGAYGVLGKAAPPFNTVGLVKVTHDNLAEGWETSLHRPLPDTVAGALK